MDTAVNAQYERVDNDLEKGVATYECKVCGETSLTRDYIRQHVKEHYPK